MTRPLRLVYWCANPEKCVCPLPILSVAQVTTAGLENTGQGGTLLPLGQVPEPGTFGIALLALVACAVVCRLSAVETRCVARWFTAIAENRHR
jgi:hypothetical protein